MKAPIIITTNKGILNEDNRSVRSDFCVTRGIPVLSLVNAILLMVPASFLLHEALQSHPDFSANPANFLKANTIAITSLGITIGIFQAVVSATILAYHCWDLRKWYLCHVVIAATLAVISVFAFCNNLHKSYTGFTFAYTGVLNSVFSLGMSILLMFPE